MNAKPCRSCGVSIVFLVTATGGKLPINADTVREGDQEYDKARHVSHFATCPDAASFRNKGRRR